MNPQNDRSEKKHNDVTKIPAFMYSNALDNQSQSVKFRIKVLDGTMTILLEQSDEQKTICS